MSDASEYSVSEHLQDGYAVVKGGIPVLSFGCLVEGWTATLGPVVVDGALSGPMEATMVVCTDEASERLRKEHGVS